MPDLPAAVYKYLTADRATSVLDKLLIRFSQASVLNDATELKPPFKGVGTEAEVKKVIAERLRQRFPDLMNRIETRLPANAAAELIDSVISKAAVQAEVALPENVKMIYDSLDRNFGVLSLSETPTDSLLWGYYGQGGYGILIRFDPQHKWFWAQQDEKDDFRHLRQVAYVSDRAPKYVLETIGVEALYSKGIEWEHEKEWRIIRNFNDAAQKVGPDEYGKDVLLFAIPPDCVQGIVIGYRAKPEVVSQLREIVARNSSLSHVHFESATMNSNGQIEIRAGDD
jgi:hypothetical protein